MMADTIGLVLLAAGYGSLPSAHRSHPIPKILADLGGLPMFLHPLMAAKRAMLERAVIVVNPRDEQLVRSVVTMALARRYIEIAPLFAVQPERRGAADALHRALPLFRDIGIDTIMVAYGDMPLWSTQTMLELTACSMCPGAAMITAERQRGFSALDRYGRVLYDKDGRIDRVVEMEHATEAEVRERIVNPSLWLWPVQWLHEHIPQLASIARPDIYGPELYMPHLVEFASRDIGMTEVRLPPKRLREALGVNTAHELKRVRMFFAQHTAS